MPHDDPHVPGELEDGQLPVGTGPFTLQNYQKDADFHTEKAAEAQAEADKAQAAADAMDVAVNELTSAAAARQETT